jgi:hypothetical protein
VGSGERIAGIRREINIGILNSIFTRSIRCV